MVADGRPDELQAGPATVSIRLNGLTGELAAELRRRYPDLRLEGERITLTLSGRAEIAELVARLVAGGCRIAVNTFKRRDI